MSPAPGPQSQGAMGNYSRQKVWGGKREDQLYALHGRSWLWVIIPLSAVLGENWEVDKQRADRRGSEERNGRENSRSKERRLCGRPGVTPRTMSLETEGGWRAWPQEVALLSAPTSFKPACRLNLAQSFFQETNVILKEQFIQKWYTHPLALLNLYTVCFSKEKIFPQQLYLQTMFLSEDFQWIWTYD